MLTFVLDIILGLVIGSQAWSMQRVLLASLAAGQIAAFALALLSLAFGGVPFSPAGALINLVLSGVLHGIVVLVCAYLRRRRVNRGYRA